MELCYALALCVGDSDGLLCSVEAVLDVDIAAACYVDSEAVEKPSVVVVVFAIDGYQLVIFYLPVVLGAVIFIMSAYGGHLNRCGVSVELEVFGKLLALSNLQ